MAAKADTQPLITLTTDFGTTDTYVGQMKGVVLGIAPAARIVDITHDVRPQQVRQGAFLTQTAWPAFPTGTIHMAVVDPGVGTDRRGLVLANEHGIFVGPDNGILSAALPEDARPPSTAGTVEVPAGVEAYEIANADLMWREVSATFHGRDVFSPVAAHLGRGVDPRDVGPTVMEVMAFPMFKAAANADGSLSGEVVHVDAYGNAITSIRAVDLPIGRFTVEVVGKEVTGPYHTFADLTGIGAVVGGSGYLGIVAPQGSAARLLSLDIGEPVQLRPRSEIPYDHTAGPG